jgi:transcriptional regulator with XRE-family HTH domain
MKGVTFMNKQGTRTAESLALRKEGGSFLKNLRQHRGLTQRDVAEACNINYYTMIAQIEAGSARMPPDHFVTYAKCLGVRSDLFIKKLMSYYDPITYSGVFGNEHITMADLLID